MTTDEKLYALMAVAEDQQKMATQLIQLQRQEFKEQMAALKNEREQINASYEKKMRFCVSKLERDANYWFVIKTTLICMSVVLIMVAGMWFYSKHLGNEILELEAQKSQMEKYNAVFGTCENQPCIRVKPSEGAFGDSENFYVIDPK